MLFFGFLMVVMVITRAAEGSECPDDITDIQCPGSSTCLDQFGRTKAVTVFETTFGQTTVTKGVTPDGILCCALTDKCGPGHVVPYSVCDITDNECPGSSTCLDMFGRPGELTYRTTDGTADGTICCRNVDQCGPVFPWWVIAVCACLLIIITIVVWCCCRCHKKKGLAGIAELTNEGMEMADASLINAALPTPAAAYAAPPPAPVPAALPVAPVVAALPSPPAPVPLPTALPVVPVVPALPSTCKALHPYTATAENQLTVAQGDILTIVDAAGPWWKVKAASGTEGLVPSNYVEKVDV